MTRGRCQVPWESPNHRLHGFGGTGHLCRLACRIHPQAAVVGKTRSKIEDWIDHRHGCSDGSSRRPSAQCDTQRIQKPTDTTAPHAHVLSVPFPHPLLSVVAVTGRCTAMPAHGRHLDHRVDAERPGGVTTQSLVTSRGPTGLQPVFRNRRRFQPVPRGAHAPPARAVSDGKLMKHDVTRQPEQRLRRPRRGW